ncbi:MAG TPA: hypothetical protein VF281_04065 [Candidatus Saccharimonadales bacterium]
MSSGTQLVRDQIWLYKTVLAQGRRLYYANAMVKAKAAGLKNKKIILISLIGLVILSAGGVAWYYWNQKQTTDAKVIVNKAKQEVEALNFEGDNDLATAYTVALKAKDITKARKLFADKIAAEPDVDKKLALSTQNVNLAIAAGNTDEALGAAQRAVDIKSSHLTLAQVANVYFAKDDLGQQVVYLQKAKDALQQSDESGKDVVAESYQERIDSSNQILEVRKRYAQ